MLNSLKTLAYLINWKSYNNSYFTCNACLVVSTMSCWKVGKSSRILLRLNNCFGVLFKFTKIFLLLIFFISLFTCLCFLLILFFLLLLLFLAFNKFIFLCFIFEIFLLVLLVLTAAIKLSHAFAKSSASYQNCRRMQWL